MIASLLSTLFACGDLTTQDTWELLAVNQDLAVLDARLTTGNTGLLKGQGHVRMDWLFRDQTAVYHGRDGLAANTRVPETGGLRVGPDSLEQDESGAWRLQIRDREARAELVLTPKYGGPAPLMWTGDSDRSWSIEAPVVLGDLQGVLSSGQRSTVVDGRGLLTHRHGDAAIGLAGTRRLAVYILGKDVTIGLDMTGSQAMSWAIVGDYAFDARDARVTVGEQGRLVLDLRPTADLVAHILPRRPRSIRLPWEHLHTLERWLLGAWRGTPTRRTQGARAHVLIGEEALEARAVIVEVSWN